MKEKMKDSGIEWIGEIPEEWEISKIKFNYVLITGFTPDTSREDYYDDEGYVWVSIADMSNKYVYDSTTKISDLYIRAKHPDIIKKGSLLYSFKLSVGKVAFAEKNIYSNEAIASFQDSERVCLDYLYYASFLIEKNANINIYGAKILNQELIKNSFTIVPTFSEQQVIADFLDKKVGQIDDILADLNKQVEILNQYKKSLITETVTKGLNPNVEMKDSEIDWIGLVPKHWKFTKLKYHSIKIGDGIHGTPEYDEGGEYRFVNGGNFGNKFIKFAGNEESISKNEFRKLYTCVLNENTVLIALNGVNVGNVSFYHGEKILLGKSAGYITLDKDFKAGYVRYYMKSNVARIIMELSLMGTTIPNLSLGTLNNFLIFMPPIQEQQVIADYLDKKCTQIDELITDKQKQIEKMKNYKKSLIYEYVTGKKRVGDRKCMMDIFSAKNTKI